MTRKANIISPEGTGLHLNTRDLYRGRLNNFSYFKENLYEVM
jgi:hypothetical protein